MPETVPHNGDLPERTSALEAWKTGVDARLTSIQASIDHLVDAISKQNRTNWGNIFAGLLVAGMLWAAAIRPLESGQDRADITSRTLADAVLKQDDRIRQNENMLATGKILREQLQTDMEEIKKNGTPGAREQLVLLNYRVGQLEIKK